MRGGADAGPSPRLRGRSCWRTTDACARRSDAGADPTAEICGDGALVPRKRAGPNERLPRRATPPIACAGAFAAPAPSPSTGQHRRWWSMRTRTPKKQYLEKRRVATCPGQSARRRRLSTLVISHHALLTHRHVLEVRRLLRLTVPVPPVPRVTLGARRSPARRWRRRRRRRRRLCSGGRARVIALGLDLLPTR